MFPPVQPLETHPLRPRCIEVRCRAVVNCNPRPEEPVAAAVEDAVAGVSTSRSPHRTSSPLEPKWLRSRLYRRRILQVNTRWKALAEIYTMHSFAPFSNLNFSLKLLKNLLIFYKNLQNLPDFC